MCISKKTTVATQRGRPVARPRGRFRHGVASPRNLKIQDLPQLVRRRGGWITAALNAVKALAATPPTTRASICGGNRGSRSADSNRRHGKHDQQWRECDHSAAVFVYCAQSNDTPGLRRSSYLPTGKP